MQAGHLMNARRRRLMWDLRDRGVQKLVVVVKAVASTPLNILLITFPWLQNLKIVAAGALLTLPDVSLEIHLGMMLRHDSLPLGMLLRLQLLVLQLRRNILLQERHLRLLRYLPFLKFWWIMNITTLVMILTTFLNWVFHFLNLKSFSIHISKKNKCYLKDDKYWVIEEQINEQPGWPKRSRAFFIL